MMTPQKTLQTPRTLALAGAAAAGLLAMAAGPVIVTRDARAAEAPAKSRYTMQPADGGGVLRLDSETGAMSICTGKEGDWSCKPMPEADAAMKKKLEDLEAENRRLKEASANLAAKSPPQAPGAGQPLGEPPKGDTVPPTSPEASKIPTEEDVDKLFDYVEGMVKKFKERIDRLEKEAKKDPPSSL